MLDTSKTLLRFSLLASLAFSVLPGCRGEAEDESDESSDAVRKTKLDLSKYAFVTASIATGNEAEAFMTVLKEGNTKTIRDGATLLAGLTERELEGGDHDPSATDSSAYGIRCGKDGIGITSCSVTAVVRAADVTTVEREGISLVKTVKITGKLGRAILSVLPATGPVRVGGSVSGYGPLAIACRSSSGHDENGQITECSIPTTGFGVAPTVKEFTEGETPMPKAEAEKLVRLFFPKG